MDFSQLNKKTSDSFYKQKNMLKMLTQGKALKCEHCGTLLMLDLVTDELKKGIIKCEQGCTSIELALGT